MTASEVRTRPDAQRAGTTDAPGDGDVGTSPRAGTAPTRAETDAAETPRPASASSASSATSASRALGTPREPRASRAPGLTAAIAANPWLRAIGGAAVPLAILLVWHLVSTTGAVPASQLPSPATVFTAGVDLAERGLLGLYVAISAQRVLIGFAIGATVGLAAGAVVGLSRVADIVLAPTFGAVRAVPSLAWIPLLILWFGIGEDSKILLIAIGAFFPVFTIVSAALRHVDPHLLEAGRAFGLRGFGLFRTVQLPSVVPSVISGLRLALAQSWLFLVAAELIASSMGLGFLLSDSGNSGRIDRIFLAIILLAVLGKLTDSLLGVFERWAKRRWT